MYMCQDHWQRLKNAIRQRGLWPLVTPSGYLAPETPEEILELNAAQFLFDPLMAASFLISQQARAAFDTSGCECPLCEVDRNLGDGVSRDWIDTDSDLLLQLCRERHLIEV